METSELEQVRARLRGGELEGHLNEMLREQRRHRWAVAGFVAFWVVVFVVAGWFLFRGPGALTSSNGQAGHEWPKSSFNKVCDGPNLLYTFGDVSAVAVSPNDPQCAPGGSMGQR